MQYESSASSRISIDSDISRTRIVIKAKRQLVLLLFLAIWLAGWTVGGLFAAATLLRADDAFGGGQLFLFFWLCGWAVGWLFAASTIIWMMFGFEIIELRSQALLRKIGALAFWRKWTFDPMKVKKLRKLQPPSGHLHQIYGLPLSGSASVAFDYGTRTISFGSALESAEADAVVEAIAERLGRGVLSA